MYPKDSLLSNEQKYKNPGDIQIHPNNKNSINMKNCILIFLNSYLGVGIAKNGKHMRCGILYSTCCNAISAVLVYYSSWMFLVCAVRYRALSTEELASASLFKWCSLITALGMFVPIIGFLSFYLMYLRDILKYLLVKTIPNCPEYLYDLYFIVFCLVLFVYPSFFFVTSLKYIKVISNLGLLCSLIVLLVYIYSAIVNAKTYGFDPRHELSLTNFSQPYFQCFTDHISTYIGYIFLSMIFNNLIDFTFNRGKQFLKYSFIIIFASIELFEFAEYIVLFNNRSEECIFFSMDPKNIFVLIGTIAYFSKIVFSIPSMINPARVVVCRFVTSSYKVAIPLWFSIGLIIIFLAMVIASITGIYYEILDCVEVLLMASMQFSFSAIVFAKEILAGRQSRIHWIGVILFIVLGFGFGIGNLAIVISKS